MRLTVERRLADAEIVTALPVPCRQHRSRLAFSFMFFALALAVDPGSALAGTVALEDGVLS